MDREPKSDEALVKACKNGEEWAQREIFRKYLEKVKTLCFRILGPVNRFELDDVVQDIFLQVFTSIHRFKGESSFSTWLYAISLNIMRSRIRQNVNTRKHLVYTDSENLYWVEDPGTDSETRAEQREKVGFLHEQVARLPGKEREAFVLAFMKELEMEEIARAMNRKVGTIKSWIFRARRRIDKAWKAQYGK